MFSFNALPVGDYVVTVTKTGFADEQQSVTVVADSSPTLHFQLSIGTVNQTTTVVAASPLQVEGIDSVTPTTLVDRQDIAQTPGADRTNSMAMITDYVPAAYVTHDMLHMRGGHQVNWLIDGVPIPNTNIATNLGPQIDPKDIDYLEVQRGSYDAGLRRSHLWNFQYRAAHRLRAQQRRGTGHLASAIGIRPTTKSISAATPSASPTMPA